MGFGNAAGSFMTGFMAGYKFIDDAQKKQQEINALKAEAETKLRNSKLEIINKEDERNKNYTEEIRKISDDAQKNAFNAPDAKTAIAIMNNAWNLQQDVTDKFNKTSASKSTLLAGTPMESYVNPAIDFKSGAVVTIDSEDGTSSFMTRKNSQLGTMIAIDLSLPKEERVYSVDKNGNVFKKDNTGKPVPIGSDGTFIDPQSNYYQQAQLTNINVVPYKAKEPTGTTPYPQEKITKQLRDRLIKANIKPDDNGIFQGLTYADVENVNKATINASLFEAKTMYNEKGEAVLATNTDELSKYLSKGYTTSNPKTSGADTQTFNALRDSYIKNGMSYLDASKKAFTQIYDIKGTQKAFTEIKPIMMAADVGAQVAQGKTVSKDDATKASALMRQKLNPSEEKAISTFKENVVSYDEFKKNYQMLQDGIKNGTYKSNIVANIFSEWAKAVPSGNMSVFGNPQALIDKYGIEANLANSLANVLKIQSGLTVNEAEANRTVGYMMGGLNANEKVKAAAYKNFIDSTEFRLTKQAENIALVDPLSAKIWLDRKQNTPKFKSQAAEAAFKQYGYKPFKIGNTTYIVDKFSKDIKKVGNK